MRSRHGYQDDGKHYRKPDDHEHGAALILSIPAAQRATGGFIDGWPQIFRLHAQWIYSDTEESAAVNYIAGRAVVLHADVAQPAKIHQPDNPLSGLDAVIRSTIGYFANKSALDRTACGAGRSCAMG
ncbi:MAG: hypothetical protein ACJ8AW_39210 [Rhodopila sp.]